LLVMDLEDELGVEISDRDADTLAGVVLTELGRRARPGDTLDLGPLVVEVLEIDRNRVKTLQVEVKAPQPAVKD